MKLKYYLRGLGVGILLTTIILSISFHSASKTQLTDEEIIKRAEQLGMEKTDDNNADLNQLLTTTIVPSQTPSEDSTEQLTVTPTKKPKDDSKSESIESTTEESTVEPTQKPKTKSNDKDDSTSKNTNSNKKTVSINVKEGMTSKQVATLLKDNGVIKDAKKFNTYLVESGFDHTINYGIFEIGVGDSYEDIADVIIVK